MYHFGLSLSEPPEEGPPQGEDLKKDSKLGGVFKRLLNRASRGGTSSEMDAVSEVECVWFRVAGEAQGEVGR